MRTSFSWVIGVALAAGCVSAEDSPGRQSSSAGAPPLTGGASAGTAGAVMPPSGGAGGVAGSVTTAPAGTGGLAGGVGGAGAGANAPPTAGSMAMPTAGTGGAGGMTAGTGGTAGSAGAGTGAGTGGVPSDCVENLGCQLEPPPTTGDAHQDCVDRVNQFRTTCACLTPLTRWTAGEACADMMAEYDSTQPDPHAGFIAGICQGGSAQNECPGWRSETMVVDRCLQGMWDEGPPPQSECSGACFQEHGHFINMTSTRSTKIACGFFTSPGGELWAVQNFSR